MKEETKYEIVDRYSALGIERPNPDTVCEGQCEGTGHVPHYKGDSELQIERQEGDDEWDKLWDIAHALPHKEECDGWHFLKCPDCNGTGKK